MNSIHILFRSFSLFFLQNRRSSRRRRYQSRFGARAPHALPSLSLSLTSQHEIYSLKSLNYILVTNFFMPLRETKDSAEYYEAVLSLKSTGLTYLPHETISSSLLCVRERHCRKRTLDFCRALRTRELFHILLDYFLLLCDSFRTTTRDDTSARCGFSRVYSHVFACV